MCTTVVNNIIKNVFEHQIGMLEQFLKDHVTLKMEILAAENSYIKFENIFRQDMNIYIYKHKLTPHLIK